MAKRKKTVVELTALADAGNRDAMAELGDRYYYGEGVRRDKAKSTEWYQKALTSMETSGGFYSSSGYSLSRSTTRAARSVVNYLGYALIAAAVTMTLLWIAHNVGYLFILFLLIIAYAIYSMMAGGNENGDKR